MSDQPKESKVWRRVRISIHQEIGTISDEELAQEAAHEPGTPGYPQWYVSAMGAEITRRRVLEE